MSDIIKLLPDALANQIAAGEVVQRPASVVKELLENALDAGATKIKLIIREGGKQGITIIDDGKGMSAMDARLCFERHATSKLHQTEDLFAIKTFGFRGEAMASIAAVAQVELKTKQEDQELGTKIIIEGSDIKSQEPCQTAKGTSITVKNLFYNVPARKAFLKSNNIELKHIDEEFKRVALSNPSVQFSFFLDEEEMAFLPASPLNQRIFNVFGPQSQSKWIPILEDTESVHITGYISKPEAAKKTRGDQYLFVNKRFIKNNYLQHAIFGAFEGMLAPGTFPMYVIFLTLDPSKIDVNVHPTKHEVKFEDEKIIYNYLKVSIKHALGKFALTPSLDFDGDPFIMQTIDRNEVLAARQERLNQKHPPSNHPAFRQEDKEQQSNWADLYEYVQKPIQEEEKTLTLSPEWGNTDHSHTGYSLFAELAKNPFQIHKSYIVNHIKSGYILIDQQFAHERILYEKYLNSLNSAEQTIQKELFPKTIKLNFADAKLLKQNLSELHKMGFEIEEFGHDSFIVQGIPATSLHGNNVEQIIEDFIFQYKSNFQSKLNLHEKLAWSMAKSSALPKGQALSNQEMIALIDQLFACENPYNCPNGKKCFITFELEDISKRF